MCCTSWHGIHFNNNNTWKGKSKFGLDWAFLLWYFTFESELCNDKLMTQRKGQIFLKKKKWFLQVTPFLWFTFLSVISALCSPKFMMQDEKRNLHSSQNRKFKNCYSAWKCMLSIIERYRSCHNKCKSSFISYLHSYF